jgi:hypothetical protein
LRSRRWHAVASLAYDEVLDVPAVVDALAKAGLLVTPDAVSDSADFYVLLEVVPAEVLRAAILQLLPANHPLMFGLAGGGKPALISAAQAAGSPRRVVEILRGLMGPLVSVAPSVSALFARLQRLYFITEGQSVSL